MKAIQYSESATNKIVGTLTKTGRKLKPTRHPSIDEYIDQAGATWGKVFGLWYENPYALT